MQRVGRHLIVELWGCDIAAMGSQGTVEEAIAKTITACGATLLDLRVYPSASAGVHGVAILAESHVMVQTWPQHGYIAVDIFTCGQHTDPNLAVPVLQRFFAPEQIQVLELNRGVMENDDTQMMDTVDCYNSAGHDRKV
jgi:S-adenosylmethionine decarboxylase